MPTFKDWIAGRTAEGTPADADELYLRDDSGDVSKRVTWSGLKTALGIDDKAPLDDPTFTGIVEAPDIVASSQITSGGSTPIRVTKVDTTGTTFDIRRIDDDETRLRVLNAAQDTYSELRFDTSANQITAYATTVDLSTGVTNVTVPNADADAEALNRITADGRYASKASLRAADFAATGAAAFIASGNLSVWALDASSIETVNGVFPADRLAGWSTARLDIRCRRTASATAGDVVWRVDSLVMGDGDNTTTGITNNGNVTRAAAGQNILDVFTYAASISLTDGKDLGLRVYRMASDAADTLAEDIQLIGVDLVKVS